MRSWIKLSLVVEREGRVYATDAFEEALRFVIALGGRIMTSTASRLSVVQREIEGLESSLNPDPWNRTVHLRHKIAELERELGPSSGANSSYCRVRGLQSAFARSTL